MRKLFLTITAIATFAGCGDPVRSAYLESENAFRDLKEACNAAAEEDVKLSKIYSTDWLGGHSEMGYSLSIYKAANAAAIAAATAAADHSQRQAADDAAYLVEKLSRDFDEQVAKLDTSRPTDAALAAARKRSESSHVDSLEYNSADLEYNSIQMARFASESARHWLRTRSWARVVFQRAMQAAEKARLSRN
jgi:hypothetical protein